jgi:hypothetical protein
MIELADKYLVSRGVGGLGSFFDASDEISHVVRYGYEKTFIEEEFRTLFLDNQKNNPPLKALVSFLFFVGAYETTIFSQPCSSLNPIGVSLPARICGIQTTIVEGSFLVGCVLKQVKGGFAVDLGGLVCFMPFSLAGGEALFPYLPKKGVVQVFKTVGFSLVSAKDHGIFLNVILSRVQVVRFLKSFLHRFFFFGVLSYRISFFAFRPTLCGIGHSFQFIGYPSVRKRGRFWSIKEVKELRF